MNKSKTIRYDCRGYLYDLEPYDADLMSDERRNPKYSKEEIEMEHACDLERYMYLKDEEQNDESGPSKNGDDDDVNGNDYDSNRGTISRILTLSLSHLKNTI